MRVLCVDDDTALLAMLDGVLTGAGYEVATVTTATAALAAVTDRRPDAILVDIGLPDLDGRSLVRRLRARPGPRLPVVLLTSFTERRDQLAGFDADADDYITKPFDTDLLLARLRAVLRGVGVNTPTAG